jgi:uncharacterized protein (TIGR02246 family)
MIRRSLPSVALLCALVGFGFLATVLLMPTSRRAEAGGQNVKADDKSTRGEDEEAVRKAAQTYVEALNKGDLDTLVAFWAPDADHVGEDGQHTRGREAIAALFKKSLPTLKDTKVGLKILSTKTLRPEVIVQDGVLEYVASEGGKDTNRFAVVWVKSGGRWLIGSARDLPVETNDLPSLAYPQLQRLEWLVGEWTDEGAKADIRITCRWAPNKTFLLMD